MGRKAVRSAAVLKCITPLKELPGFTRLWNWNELESESLCFGPKFGLLTLFVAEWGSGKPAVFELLSGRNEMEDDPRNLWAAAVIVWEGRVWRAFVDRNRRVRFCCDATTGRPFAML